MEFVKPGKKLTAAGKAIEAKVQRAKALARQKEHLITKKSYWLYSENVDEAGVVVEATDPQDALREALKIWDPQDGVVWANELGDLTCLGRQRARP